ncbi:unnamed protein product, partial [Scytosiphon promiscuus]
QLCTCLFLWYHTTQYMIHGASFPAFLLSLFRRCLRQVRARDSLQQALPRTGMAETTCPVFRPTEQEFKSFRRYIEDVVDPIAGKAGLCKVIPPPGWAARRRDAAEEMCKSVHIPAPIRQCVSSTRSNGVYSVDVVENPPMSLAEFKEYADKRAPFPSSTATAGFAGSAAVGVRRGRVGLVVRDGRWREKEGVGWGRVGGLGWRRPETFPGATQRSGTGARSAGNPTDRAGTQESEVARRVRMFWRSLGPNSEAPVYGADTLGTLFADEDDDAWNDTILQLLKANLPGITTAMLYAGMWRSMFAFHVEDVNLYSINYLHRGDPKSWYGIPPGSRQRFESLAQAFFTEEFRACKDYMRHKTTMISPLQIQRAGIAYCTAVQEAGEFMITFPGSYHGGFNHGFNLAESTNFALDRWIRQGRGAGYCRCSPHSVRIDVDRFETLVRQHRRIAGKEATCLNGLAEGPVRPSLPDGGASDATRKTQAGSGVATASAAAAAAAAAAAPGEREEASNSRSSGNSALREDLDAETSSSDEDDSDDSEEEERKRREEVEEDIQVFHCVCSNARSVRRVLRTEDGTGFVPLPAPVPAPASAAKTTVPWPEESQCSECPRCGVWGHKACLEYVVPPQFAIPEKLFGAGFTTASVPAGGGGGGGAGDPGAGEGAAPAGDAAARDGTQGAPGGAHSTANGPSGTASTAGAVFAGEGTPAAPAPPPPPPRPVCWMCMQEQEEVTAMGVSSGGGAAGGMAAAAPRRPGKSSGGSMSGGGGGGGGGSSGGNVSARNSPGRGPLGTDNGGSSSSSSSKGGVGGGGNKKEAKKRSGCVGVGGKGEERKGGKKARVGEGGVASSGSGGGAAAGRRKSPDGSAAASSAAVGSAAAAPAASKRARVGQKLIGKEVLVSDGVAAVLTGVVTEIEAGQARVHYKGRKAKLDEWIDVRSERFLSTAEAKKQIELTQLAMNPSAAAAPASLGGSAAKKRKAGALGGGEGTGAEGKRAKKVGDKGGGGGIVKAKMVKGGVKGAGKAGKVPGDVGKASPPAKPKKIKKEGQRDVAGGGSKKTAGDKKAPKSTASVSEQHGNGFGGGGKKAAVGKAEGAGRDKASSPKIKGNVKVGKVKLGKVKLGKVPAVKADGGSNAVAKNSGGGGKLNFESRSGSPAQAKDVGGGLKRPIGSNGTAAAAAAAENGGGRTNGSNKGKKKKKKGGSEKQEKPKAKKPFAVKPVVIAPPVVVQKAVPEHHVISNRRAVVLARTFAKETEEAQKDFQDAVAAAERSRIARKHRAKSSSSPRGVNKKGKGAAAAAAKGRGPGGVARAGGRKPSGGAASSATVDSPRRTAGVAPGDPPGPAPSDATAAANTGERWPDLGFVGQPWGHGPFHREMDSGGHADDDDDDEDDKASPSCARPGEVVASAKSPFFSRLAPSGIGWSVGGQAGATAGLPGEFQKSGEGVQGGGRLPGGVLSPAAAAAAAAAAALGVGVSSRPRRAPKEMRRARVDAGEAVDLGEEAAFRAWLTRLRAVQDIPVGHVEACSRSLAVLLGTSPPDGSIRASVRALLVAETLRGGASHEVATFVRSLAGLLADAASKARP